MISRSVSNLFSLLLLLFPSWSFAADTATLNPVSTAWVMTSIVFVMIMFIPGLALFYGGMLRSKNVLSICTQFFAFAGIVGLLWIFFAYSMVVDTTGMQEGVFNLSSFVGGFDKAFMHGITDQTLMGDIPEFVTCVFGMTFAMITPAIVVGGYAERMKFSAMVLFVILWTTLVYAPLAHMVWGGPGSAMHNWGVLDFAGGTAVHINSGIAALVGALIIGKRKDWKTRNIAPHNLVYTFIGAGLLWAGWFGFNVGSALAANNSAGLILINTQVAACAGIVGWMIIAKFHVTHTSSLGLASGAIAGLVGITPAAAYVGILGATAIGLMTSMCCFYAVTHLKHRLDIDDSLDVFALHGIGGIVGGVLTGIFASSALGGNIIDLNYGTQFIAQIIGILVTVVYSGILTWGIFKLIDATIGLRVSNEQEEKGLDLSDHNEQAYN
ncbi:ammonium transporter [Acinetobacter soli]|uniref:Ammonium transporter n=1 Tax=Acinetobacter soli TaxID=487316 RepID=A0AB38YT45_9GAMM|nr:ammonium transporter [Acinetobacter soli]KQC99205.1 ammonia channel protein [Acinetobacter soli]MDQ8941987.1 ammonium transporter [Acinetobacter soli]WEH93199.1 ammonium transporter [Acinetobacter soli]WEH97605.1 ammonium transporter [Acinetobacter soli]WEH99491.1 ammonium transporter [Acinetobacter soli]